MLTFTHDMVRNPRFQHMTAVRIHRLEMKRVHTIIRHQDGGGLECMGMRQVRTRSQRQSRLLQVHTQSVEQLQ